MDPYKVLGVTPQTSDDDVKRAYRELARKYHPDNYVNNPLADLAETRMKEINEAYDMIMNERRNPAGGSSGQQQSYGGAYNGQQYGGGYCAAPHASMTDGLLDVVLLRPVPRLKLPGLLGSYKKGEHLSEGDTVTGKFAPYMMFFRTGSIDIEVLDGNPLITTLDGECSPQLRMHAEIAHSAARILLPPELAANANKTPVLQAMGE